MTERLLIGSGNPGKQREYRELLAGLDLELVTPDDLDPVPPDRAPGLTGYLLAFVPPVALECPATLVVDERVASQDVVYAAAGEPGVILKVRGADLIKATSAIVASITRQAN